MKNNNYFQKIPRGSRFPLDLGDLGNGYALDMSSASVKKQSNTISCKKERESCLRLLSFFFSPIGAVCGRPETDLYKKSLGSTISFQILNSCGGGMEIRCVG